MIYVWAFIFFLIILRSRSSNKINVKYQRWANIFLIFLGIIAVGLIVYTYFSVNS
ncbi:hypothetical protein [Enterococcus durans]|uniref:Uncharacterized protein n=1 Tax=Enterococcus durans TaxID=53345 RepID=A0A367CIL8_9ENTE|nr:hypothetical protein [Enterococcus durans]RCA12298.1 hypothetical protein EA71_00505 [Enterococcus durans]